MNFRFPLVCSCVFAAFVALGLAMPWGLRAWSHDDAKETTLSSAEGSSHVRVDRIPAEDETAGNPQGCLEDRRALSEARQELELRRRESATALQVATIYDTAADRRPPADVDVDDSPETESRIRALIERRKLTGLAVDCGEPPCLVFGAGKPDLVAPLADAIADDEYFESLRPVVVSRVVVDRDRQPDTVSALALMSEEDYGDVAARAAFEAMLRRRIGRLQE